MPLVTIMMENLTIIMMITIHTPNISKVDEETFETLCFPDKS